MVVKDRSSECIIDSNEVDNVVQEQLLGGQANKSHSIICNTHYSKLSKINLVNRQY